MNVFRLAYSSLTWIWLCGRINGTERARAGRLIRRLCKCHSGPIGTVDALLIRGEDQCKSHFRQCRLSLRQYKWDKGNTCCIGSWWVAVRLSWAWYPAFLWGINSVAAKIKTPATELSSHFFIFFPCDLQQVQKVFLNQKHDSYCKLGFPWYNGTHLHREMTERQGKRTPCGVVLFVLSLARPADFSRRIRPFSCITMLVWLLLLNRED